MNHYRPETLGFVGRGTAIIPLHLRDWIVNAISASFEDPEGMPDGPDWITKWTNSDQVQRIFRSEQ
jgi:hypothetical protein